MFSEPGADDVAAQGAEPDALASAVALAHSHTERYSHGIARTHGFSDVPALARADPFAHCRARRQR